MYNFIYIDKNYFKVNKYDSFKILKTDDYCFLSTTLSN